ncbi:hypothetical protein PG993_012803, partial [Apiospora rasikravindrae]
QQWNNGDQSTAGNQGQDDQAHDYHLPEAPESWRTHKLNSAHIHADAQALSQICAQSHLSIVSVGTHLLQGPRLTSTRVASANQARTCPTCREVFTATFGIPGEWWSDHYRNANGYFGCVEQDLGGAPTFDTWGRFQAKMVRGASDFEWEKIHLFTRWSPSLNRTMVVLFDMSPPVVSRLSESLAKVDKHQHIDPFWVYTRIAEELASLHDESVWAIRTHVRDIEKGDKPQGQQQPDFRRLHDLARHAIHVTETLDVSMQTLAAVLAQHKDIRLEAGSNEEGAHVWKNVRQRLLAHKQIIDNLRCRSQSNQDRLQNEIQLAFNLVALEDSKTSIGISRAAKTDSTAMKTISFLTLIFLPPTFICAIFSMSFFNYDAEGGWTVSPKFWIYWAFAVPLTVVCSVMYYLWQASLSSSKPYKEFQYKLTTTEVSQF